MSSPNSPQGSTPNPWQHQGSPQGSPQGPWSAPSAPPPPNQLHPYQPQQPTYQPQAPGMPVRWAAGQIGPAGLPVKSKVAAGLLGIFLGALGVHNFYLGRIGVGVAQLLIWLAVWPAMLLFGLGFFIWGALGIWALVEAILCFTGGLRDGHGQPLGD